jgi:ubiquinone/menaquinone biosynthesis C-methylase UbiE
MPTHDQIRTEQRDRWNLFSRGWEKWDDVVMSMTGGVGTAMVDSLDVRDDQQHVDIAAGTGEPGLTVAARAPKGRVVLTDIAAQMLEAAKRRAQAKGLDNVEFRECSADDLPFEDATFDSVACRFGFMFFPDLAATARELVRVVKPGGRVCAAVWAGPDVNPWTTIPMAAISTEIEVPPPDPDAPGMFRCAAPGAMRGLFEGAGLHDIVERDVPTSMTPDSPDQYWQLLTELTAPVIALLDQVDDAARERIATKVKERAAAFETDGELRIPGMAHVIVGTK